MTKVTFITSDDVKHDVEIENGFTLMEASVRNNVPGITADCGGACACGTCHVYVEPEWVEATGAPSEAETGMLEFAMDPKPNSRLSCQIKVTAALEGLTVRVPDAQY
jgi:2Fe-2S ferredoxin